MCFYLCSCAFSSVGSSTHSTGNLKNAYSLFFLAISKVAEVKETSLVKAEYRGGREKYVYMQPFCHFRYDFSVTFGMKCNFLLVRSSPRGCIAGVDPERFPALLQFVIKKAIFHNKCKFSSRIPKFVIFLVHIRFLNRKMELGDDYSE